MDGTAADGAAQQPRAGAPMREPVPIIEILSSDDDEVAASNAASASSMRAQGPSATPAAPAPAPAPAAAAPPVRMPMTVERASELERQGLLSKAPIRLSFVAGAPAVAWPAASWGAAAAAASAAAAAATAAAPVISLAALAERERWGGGGLAAAGSSKTLKQEEVLQQQESWRSSQAGAATAAANNNVGTTARPSAAVEEVNAPEVGTPGERRNNGGPAASSPLAAATVVAPATVAAAAAVARPRATGAVSLSTATASVSSLPRTSGGPGGGVEHGSGVQARRRRRFEQARPQHFEMDPDPFREAIGAAEAAAEAMVAGPSSRAAAGARTASDSRRGGVGRRASIGAAISASACNLTAAEASEFEAERAGSWPPGTCVGSAPAGATTDAPPRAGKRLVRRPPHMQQQPQQQQQQSEQQQGGRQQPAPSPATAWQLVGSLARACSALPQAPLAAVAAAPGRMWVLGEYMTEQVTRCFVAMRHAWLHGLGARARMRYSEWFSLGFYLFYMSDGASSDGRTRNLQLPNRRPLLEVLENLVVALVCRALGIEDPTVEQLAMHLPPHLPCHPFLEVFTTPGHVQLGPGMRGVRISIPQVPRQVRVAAVAKMEAGGPSATLTEAEAVAACAAKGVATSPLLGPYSGDAVLRRELEPFKGRAPAWFRNRFPRDVPAPAWFRARFPNCPEPVSVHVIDALYADFVDRYAHDMEHDLLHAAECMGLQPGEEGEGGGGADAEGGGKVQALLKQAFPEQRAWTAADEQQLRQGGGGAPVHKSTYTITVSAHPYHGDVADVPAAARGNICSLFNDPTPDPRDQCGLTRADAQRLERKANASVATVRLFCVPEPEQQARQEQGLPESKAEGSAGAGQALRKRKRKGGRRRKRGGRRGGKRRGGGGWWGGGREQSSEATSSSSSSSDDSAEEDEPVKAGPSFMAPRMLATSGFPIPVMESLVDQYGHGDEVLYGYGTDFWLTTGSSDGRVHSRIEAEVEEAQAAAMACIDT